MTTHDFLRYVLLIAAVMAVISLVEVALPLYVRNERGRGRVPANLALTALVFILNWAMTTASALIVLPRKPLPLPMAAQIAISVVVLDFFTYVAHASMHKLPWLWRFHRIHHSDPFVDATTTYRFHPMEGLWRFLWTMVPALALGLPAAGIVVYRLISALNGLLEHANVPVWRPLDRVLSFVWVTPNMHKVHHSAERRQTDSNYGNILSLFDRLFRTFTPTEQAFDLTYGLGDTELKRVKSLRGLIKMPFQP
jgi:sterol desaturase/sphingolipid hydroxylase (fatty acid hydroxylase superfamily)